MDEIGKRLAKVRKLETIADEARGALKMPDLSDRVVCFISEWERSNFEKAARAADEKEYLLQESKIFSQIKQDFLHGNIFSFLVYREFDMRGFASKNDDNDEIIKLIRKISEEFIKTKQQKELYNLESRLSRIVRDDICVLPENDQWKEFIDNEKTIDSKRVSVLCVDYSFFADSILLKFLDYYENIFRKRKKDFNVTQSKLIPLFNLFADISDGVKFSSMIELSQVLLSSKEDPFSIEGWDEVQFLSHGHVQHINDPTFWKNHLTQTSGYLCKYNFSNKKTLARNEEVVEGSDVKHDYRFFYSFESLLCWELVNLLERSGRCKNCNRPLPANSRKGKMYCNNPECRKRVNKLKQQKFYNKNHKNLT